jgi:hypothetical protein
VGVDTIGKEKYNYGIKYPRKGLRKYHGAYTI